MGERFDVRVLAWSAEPEQAVAALIEALPIDRATAQQLVDRAPLTVKRSVDRATASRYLALLEHAGAQVEVSRVGGANALEPSLAMAGDVAEFVGAEGRKEDTARFLVEPMWEPDERLVVEQARAQRDPYAVLPIGMAAHSLPPLPASSKPPSAWSPGIPGLQVTQRAQSAPLGMQSTPSAERPSSLPPALQDDDMAESPAVLGNDGGARGSLGDEAAPALELDADPRRHRTNAPVAVVGPHDASTRPAAPDARIARAKAAVAALSRIGTTLVDRLYAWGERHGQPVRLRKGDAAWLRWRAITLREFAIFVVWAIDLGRTAHAYVAHATSRLYALSRSTRHDAPAASAQTSQQPMVSHWPARRVSSRAPAAARFPALPQVANASCIFLGGMHFDSSVLLGNASVLSVMAHGLAIFALGSGLSALRQR